MSSDDGLSTVVTVEGPKSEIIHVVSNSSAPATNSTKPDVIHVMNSKHSSGKAAVQPQIITIPTLQGSQQHLGISNIGSPQNPVSGVQTITLNTSAGNVTLPFSPAAMVGTHDHSKTF